MRTTEPDLEPAATIISKCGGERIVAHWLGIDRTRVVRFRRPRSLGGTDGLIPSKHQHKLLEAARENGVALEPADFFATEAA